MAFRRRRSTFRRRPRARVPRRRVVRGKRVSRVAVKRVVKQALARTVETKTVGFEPVARNLFFGTSTSFDTQNIFRLGYGLDGLQLPQGVLDGQRVGNRVKNKRVMFNFILRPRPYNSTDNPTPRPMMIRVVLFYDKTVPSTTPQPKIDFFDYNSSVVGFSGDLGDILGPVNENRYRKLAERTFKLGFSEYGYPQPVGGNMAYTNNDFKLNVMQKWDVTKYLPKTVVFNDAATTPTSRGLFAVFIPAWADSAVGPNIDVPATVTWWMTGRYQDA